MNLKANMVVFSHLSDIQESADYLSVERNEKINFVKYIINQCGGNLNIEIDADAMWNEFSTEEAYKNLPALTEDEIIEFVTPNMMLELKSHIVDNKRLSAIKYLFDQAKAQGKRITLFEAKHYVDKFAEFLKTAPIVKPFKKNNV